MTRHPPDHPQIEVRLPVQVGGGRTEIDRDLVPLLQEIWRRGWSTFASCQDANGDGTLAQIVFDSGADVMEFLAAAEIDERVGTRVLLSSSRTGPYVRQPTAVYFDRRWIAPAAERLAGGAGSPQGNWAQLRADRTRRACDV